MQVSFNELDARLKKAAKGSGLPWGLAEEFAKSLLWLAQSGVVLEAWVAEFLSDTRATDLLGEWSYQLDLRTSPTEGADLSDAQYWVWLGFVGRFAKSEGGEVVLSDLRLGPQGLVFNPGVVKNRGRVQGLSNLRAEVAEEVWMQLENLEFKTYAPDSEISRLKGAGAGVTDND